MKSVLKSPREIEQSISHLFEQSKVCKILVREDKAFAAEGWLDLAEVKLFCGAPEGILNACRKGAYEISLVDASSVRQQLITCLAVKEPVKSDSKLRRIVDAIAAIFVRVGLVNPRFDPHALEGMPFRRSTTIVADTSGVLQGGLSFVARYLHPTARIKVPAVVQMEIVNLTERFLSCRRAAKVRQPDILVDHLLSQGGQRVLLRLELDADTEIERTFLLGDPIRTAFQRDNESDLSELNLSVPVRTYVDRLILEAARQHQAQSSYGHKVKLLTSDQGLARMALVEGVEPLFFNAVAGEDVLGKCLTGANLDPFSGTLNQISLSSILWELATAFGGMKISDESGEHYIQISAFGEDFPWSPYQSHDDLLWCEVHNLTGLADSDRPEDVAVSEVDVSGTDNQKKIRRNKSLPTVEKATVERVAQSKSLESGGSVLRPNVEKLFRLITLLDDRRQLAEESVLEVLQIKSGGLDEYRRFLTSGDLISINEKNWTANDELTAVAIALRQSAPKDLLHSLRSVPTVQRLSKEFETLQIGKVWDSSMFKRGLTTYTVLGECTLLCATVYNKGVFATPTMPSVDSFAEIALNRFTELAQGERLVATGAWLETLIEKDGIHPENARALLQQASVRNLLRRTTEGSTIETSFDKHVVHVLRQKDNLPVIEAIHLYRGDYIIPDKSSVSLRIEEPAK
ncbi:hypothetical protein IAE29_03775 [Ochrobactrum sp. S46]|nr:hypothetical protein [Ochrobactrum sp. S45]MBK0042438.1 hypothetical protein [Ochrobactrum sp. S46]